ncbi:MAG TPA: hypothetical protein DGG94_04595 [Micromonosporaceae bacterium]|nr:hypothetical protein [Micromonosporaceae bacterium]
MPYLAALGLTLLIEVPVYALVLGRDRRVLAAAIVVNLLTHPLVWLLAPSNFVAVELAAWTVEFGLFYLALRRSPAVLLATAVLANSLSCLAGLLLS